VQTKAMSFEYIFGRKTLIAVKIGKNSTLGSAQQLPFLLNRGYTGYEHKPTQN